MIQIAPTNYTQSLLKELQRKGIVGPSHTAENLMHSLLNSKELIMSLSRSKQTPKQTLADSHLENLFLSNDVEDLREVFTVAGSEPITGIAMEFTKDDYQAVKSVINDKFPSLGGILTYTFTKHLVEKHSWLLVEIKFGTFSDTYPRDGFIEWASLDLINEEIANGLINPEKLKKQIYRMDAAIRERHKE